MAVLKASVSHYSRIIMKPLEQQIADDMNLWMKERQMTADDVHELTRHRDSAHFTYLGKRWAVTLTSTGRVKKHSSRAIDMDD